MKGRQLHSQCRIDDQVVTVRCLAVGLTRSYTRVAELLDLAIEHHHTKRLLDKESKRSR